MQWSTAGLGRLGVGGSRGRGWGGGGLEGRGSVGMGKRGQSNVWFPPLTWQIGHHDTGLPCPVKVESGVDAGPFLALSGGGPFPEFRVIV